VSVQAAKVPLEVNQPVTGTVKFIAHYPDKPSTQEEGKVMPASWCLTGTFDWVDADEIHQRAEGKLYITEFQLVNTPLQLGLAIEDGQWPDGNKKYKWTYNQSVRISKRKETGGKKVTVTITRLTELPTASGAVPTPPVASPGRATAEVTRSNSTATPVAVPPQDEQWDALKRQYTKAVNTATQIWGETDLNVSDQAFVASVATLFIEANKRGLSVPAPHVKPTAEAKATAIRDAIDKYAEKPLPIQKGEEEDDSLPF
jgi:hypothetical protein